MSKPATLARAGFQRDLLVSYFSCNGITHVAEKPPKLQDGALTAFLDTLSSSVNSGDVFVQRQLTTTDLKDYAARTYRGSGTLMTMASE